MMMSSKYTKQVWKVSPARAMFMTLWKVAPAPHNPNGITLNWYDPVLVTNDVFSALSGCIFT